VQINKDNKESQVADLFFEEALYKQYIFCGSVFNQEETSLFDLTLAKHLEEWAEEQKEKEYQHCTTIMMYGQRASGKSRLVGSLFQDPWQGRSLIFRTLAGVFA